MKVTAVTAPATVTWNGATSTDWATGTNRDNTLGPAQSDTAGINSGTALFSTGTSVALNSLQLVGGTMTISGGTFNATNSSSKDSWVDGTLICTGGTTKFNELEIGRTTGKSGSLVISGGDVSVTRSLSGNSLYLGGHRGVTNAGAGNFTVLGSAATQIGIGAANIDTDGTMACM